MAKYKIENGVELPKGVKLARKAAKNVQPVDGVEYPIYEMGLGDSFKVKGVTARDLRNTIHRSRKRQSMAFTAKTYRGKNGELKFTRVWRVK